MKPPIALGIGDGVAAIWTEGPPPFVNTKVNTDEINGWTDGRRGSEVISRTPSTRVPKNITAIAILIEERVDREIQFHI